MGNPDQPDNEPVDPLDDTISDVFHIVDIDGALTLKLNNENEHRELFDPDSLQKDESGHSAFTTQHKRLLNGINENDTILCGSSRTCASSDLLNAIKVSGKHTLSLTKFMNTIQEHTGAKLDTALFGDLSHHSKPGDTWNEIIGIWQYLNNNNIAWEKKGKGWFYIKNNGTNKRSAIPIDTLRCISDLEKEKRIKKRARNDENKLSLIYAIIQYITHTYLAKKNEKDITIKFYDDKNSILDALAIYYTRNPQLIPEGITLKLYQYGILEENVRLGKSHNYIPTLNYTLKGEGIPHPHYSEAALCLARNIKHDVNQLIDIGTGSRNNESPETLLTLKLNYLIATVALLSIAAMIVGLAVDDVSSVIFDTLGDSAKSDLDDKFAGQYGLAGALVLFACFTGYNTVSKSTQQSSTQDNADRRPVVA